MGRISFRRSATMRLAALYSLLSLVAFAILFSIVLWSSLHNLRLQNRESVEQDSRALQKTYLSDGEAKLRENLRTLSASVEAKQALYQLQDAHGNVLLGMAAAITPFDGWSDIVVRLPNGRTAKYLAYSLHLDDKSLIVGRRTRGLWRKQATLLKSFAWALALVIPLTFLGASVLASRAFSRVEAIDRVMRAFADGDLKQRIVLGDSRDEITRLATDINNLLARVEKLFDALKQVTTDIAHDLRTPLGRLRRLLTDAKELEAGGNSVQSHLDRSLGDIEGIIATFDALLQIAALDAGSRSATLKDISLAQLVTDVHEIYESVAEDNRHELRLRIAGAPSVRGDARLLTQLLVNLIENAIRHTPDGTVIDLLAEDRAGKARLVVSDDGPGIPHDQEALVFERFYRLDASRTTPGNGLGLPLVKAIAEMHGAKVSLDGDMPGLTIEVAFGSAALSATDGEAHA